MLLQLSTWPEVESYLTRSRGVIVPMGSTEQHGPTGLIGTDALCAEVIAHGAGVAAGALVGPTIALGPAQFNLGFAGTVSVRPTTLIALIQDYVLSLARHGFERFYFLNGHGGNVAPARAAFQEIYTPLSLAGAADPRTIRCRLRSWWSTPVWTGSGASCTGTGRASTPRPARWRSSSTPSGMRSGRRR